MISALSKKMNKYVNTEKKIGLLRILIFIYDSNGFDGFVEVSFFFLNFWTNYDLLSIKSDFCEEKKSVGLPSAVCHSESKFVSTTSI
jgi:hypothetical protein